MKKKIGLLLLVFIALFLSTACTKNMKPYSKEQVLRFAKESYHRDFKIIKTEVIREVPVDIEYTLVAVDNEDLEFVISVYVSQGNIDGARMGSYSRGISSGYIYGVMQLANEEIEELRKQTNGHVINEDGLTDIAYAVEFADLEIIAEYIVKKDQAYNFTYDASINNPISRAGERIPKIRLDKVDTLENLEDSYYIVEMKYSMFKEKLEYSEVLEELTRSYIEDVKHNRFIDDTIPGDLYNKAPFLIIQEMKINNRNVVTTMPGVFRDYDILFLYDENLNDYLLRTKIAFPYNNKDIDGSIKWWVTEYLGGSYEVTEGGTRDHQKNIATWTIGNNTISADVEFKKGRLESVIFSKNGKRMDIKAYEQPQNYQIGAYAEAEIWIRLSDLEELLSVNVTTDQITGIISLNSK